MKIYKSTLASLALVFSIPIVIAILAISPLFAGPPAGYTLYVGESIAMLYPSDKPSLSYIIGAGTVEGLRANINIIPRMCINDIVIIGGVADLMFTAERGKTEQSIHAQLLLLGQELENSFNVKPHILKPSVVLDIAYGNPSENTTDGIHLSVKGYELLAVAMKNPDSWLSNP